ncbi:signal recognition particle receptor subunit alpha, partial [bacterium]|nr:signal recognition particle receptor subunit alpha [bacterium]
MAENDKKEKRGFFRRFIGGKEQAPEKQDEHGEDPVVETELGSETAFSAAPPVESPAPAAVEEPVLETKESLFSRLKKQLGKTKKGMVEKVREVIRLHGKVDEELLEEIEMILIQADVGIQTTTKIVDEMRRRSEARKADTPEELIGVFKKALLDIVAHDERHLCLLPDPPTVILVTGVNGTGKTTTVGKMAREYRNQGKRV